RRLRRPRHAVRPTPRADTLAVRPRPETRSRVGSNVDLVDLRGALHDELEARSDIAAHECLDGALGGGGVTDGGAEQRAAGRVQRRLLERPRIHLAEPLEAGHLDAIAVPAGEQAVLLGVVARPEDLLPHLDPVERWLRDVDEALPDELGEMPVE